MNKLLLALTLVTILPGCSTMSTEWRFQLDMQYVSPDLKAAREAEFERQRRATVNQGKSI